MSQEPLPRCPSTPVSNATKSQQQTVIISAFPCVGKSELERRCKANGGMYRGYTVIDLQSSPYRYDNPGNQRQSHDFAERYLAAVKIAAEAHQRCIILTAAQPEIRHALAEAAVKYVFLYPNEEIKMHWLQRMESRGGRDIMWNFVDQNWDEIVAGTARGWRFEQSKGVMTQEIQKGQYLLDVLEGVLQRW